MFVVAGMGSVLGIASVPSALIVTGVATVPRTAGMRRRRHRVMPVRLGRMRMRFGICVRRMVFAGMTTVLSVRTRHAIHQSLEAVASASALTRSHTRST